MAEEFFPKFISMITQKPTSDRGAVFTFVISLAILVWVVASAWTAAYEAWIKPIVDAINVEEFEGLDESVVRVVLIVIVTVIYMIIVGFILRRLRTILRNLLSSGRSSTARYEEMIKLQAEVIKSQKEIASSQKEMAESHKKMVDSQDKTLKLQIDTLNAFSELVDIARRQPNR